MKRIYSLVVFMLLTVTAMKAQTPLQFNDDLATITDSLYAKGQKWGLKFNEAYTNGNYSVLKPLADGMLAYINLKITYVQNKADVKNSKPLRMAMLDMLAFEKQMVFEGFRPFETFDAATAKEKVQAALSSLKGKSKEEDAYIQKVAAAQETYAAENGFKIQPAMNNK